MTTIGRNELEDTYNANVYFVIVLLVNIRFCVLSISYNYLNDTQIMCCQLTAFHVIFLIDYKSHFEYMSD